MSTTAAAREIWLIRHGETEWSKSGQHTGRTDIALTDHGRQQAEALRPILARQSFDRVLSSPLGRAMETCRLAGLGERAEAEPLLLEWDYGIYEGRTTPDIRKDVPDWTIWNSPIPQGESLEAIQERARTLVARLEQLPGRTALFAHGHILRVLAGVWIGDSARLGAHLVLGTATVSVLGYEREARAIVRWNAESR